MSWLSRRRASSVIESFRNLDLELSGYERQGDVERVKIRVLDCPVGGQGPDQLESVELPPGLRDRARQLETRDLDLEGMKRLGAELAAVLLPETARELYHRSLDRIAPTEGLRIRLRLGTWALATLPWEYAYVRPRGAPEAEQVTLGFWALNRRLSLVRFEILPEPPGNLDPVDGDLLRLVALTAEPKGSADLALEGEMASIEEAASDIDALRFEKRPNATWAQLQGALDQAAHILHFAGHGRFDVEMGEDYGTFEGRGSLLFETEDGEEDARPAQEVALNLNQTGVRLVVLAACEGGRVDGIRAWSGIAPALARSGVPAVVAMQFRVRDDKALAFSRRFYENLAAGGSIDTAVTAGRLAMFDSKDDYGRDWGAPVLYLNTDEGRLFPRPEAEAESKPRLTGRFVANASMGVGLFVLVAIYYLLHLAPRLSGFYLLGGVSVPVVLSLLLLAVDKLFDTSILDSFRGWLRRRSATPWLAAALTVIVALGFVTTSVYLIPEPDAESPYQVGVSVPDLAINDVFDVQSEAEGQILFLEVWRPIKVMLSPGAGSGFSDRQRTLYPWGSIHHRVPRDFDAKRIALLRLVPSIGIFNKFEIGGHVVLRITVKGRSAVEIPNPPRRALVIGDRREEIGRKLGEAAPQLEEQLRSHLAAGPIPVGRHEAFLGLWSDPVTDREILLGPQDEVLVEVLVDGAAIFSKSVRREPGDDGVLDVFMEAN